jgi:hypothetical protein
MPDDQPIGRIESDARASDLASKHRRERADDQRFNRLRGYVIFGVLLVAIAVGVYVAQRVATDQALNGLRTALVEVQLAGCEIDNRRRAYEQADAQFDADIGHLVVGELFPILDCQQTIAEGRLVELPRAEETRYVNAIERGRYPVIEDREVVAIHESPRVSPFTSLAPEE